MKNKIIHLYRKNALTRNDRHKSRSNSNTFGVYKTYIHGILLVAVLSMALISCAIRKEVKLGHEAFQSKNWDEAVEHFLKAVKEKPNNVEYRISLSNALISASNEHMKFGIQLLEDKQYKPALIELEKALEYNPENNNAHIKKRQLLDEMKKLEKLSREKTEIEKLKENAAKIDIQSPEVKFEKKPYGLKFASIDLKQMFKALQKTSGINFLFDESFKSKRIEIDIQDVGFMELLDLIMLQTNLFYKIINPHTIMIIPDNPSKRKDYEELIIKSFFLSYIDPEEILKLVTSLTGIKSTAINKGAGILILKGTPDEINLAQRIIQSQDKPKGEILVDIEVIEVNRNRTKEYGIELNQYQITESYSPLGTKENGTIRLNMIPHTDMSDYLLTVPTINYKLLRTDSDSKIKARPQLRGIDQTPVEVKLGDKVPVPSTSFVPFSTGGQPQQPITSYTLQDVGININLTPRIHHDGHVTLTMKFELTFVTNPGNERIPPTIGNRSITTTIKLRDSETSILAGLLRDTERKTMRGVPFLSNIPILKDIFSGNTKSIEQTDIILTITPRIIRYPEITEQDLNEIWAGTQTKPALKTPPHSLKFDDDSEETAQNITSGSTHKTPKDKEDKEPKKTTAEITQSPEIKEKEESKEEEPVLGNTEEKGTEKNDKNTGNVGNTKKPGKAILQFTMGEGEKRIKKNNEGNFPITIDGTGKVSSIIMKLAVTPALLDILEIKEGPALEQKKNKYHLLKSFDNKEGVIQLTFSFEEPLVLNGSAQLATVRFSAPKNGEAKLTASALRVQDTDMKILEAICSEGVITIGE